MGREFERYMSEECERLILSHWSKQIIERKLDDVIKFVTEEINPYCEEMKKEGRIWYYQGRELPFPTVQIKKTPLSLLLQLSIEEEQRPLDNEDIKASKNGEEKRKYPRVDSKFMINYKTDLVSAYDLTQTENISQGGVLLTINKMFTKGTILSMIIRFPLIPQKIEVKGEVVNVKQKGNSRFFETRIRFLNLDEEISNKLGEFINERLKRIS
ncbi:MAG: PilZ domain-containing protein [Candidatus Omnitrophica bacterium]|jgi:Tfp pilus assembly protein PilZ|nr:PilZ domain-containing protein [Candidatus Omnitrophota bacterium]